MQAFSAAAPGRINLLGEHTDYTGGVVLPLAIPFKTNVQIVPAEEDYLFSSRQFHSERLMARYDRSGARGDWTDYAVGVLRELQALGLDPLPFRLEVDGDIPTGAGLSSSAALEVATCFNG